MKRVLLLLAIAISGLSCERHEFDGPKGTRQLHEHAPHHAEAAAPAEAHAH